MILALRTDSPVAQIHVLSASGELQSQFSWQADRQLARDLLAKINEQLTKNNLDFKDVSGVIVFAGPGSFTGLRIGITVANTIAYGNTVPIVAPSGDNWLKQGIKELLAGKNNKIALPQYGADAHITLPKK
ncbi:MAG TPA: tRNA (adenosine(37)-N6)-threonylcarbamoyltransferase complex dimerization subunit type 1 TsaB [Candidatus Saccharimonadales bacterium]|nr:tRNA (adenosine(37)-N6)-threonylcarbamoyltransferase complex dimerization subunit type 1 TsaB [Candidatus Saccharimonadales bacterium]